MTKRSLARLILKNHNTGSMAFRKDYFEYLAGSSSDYINDIETLSQEVSAADKRSMKCGVHLLNRIFMLLEPYALELNQAISEKRFTITPTAPEFTEEVMTGAWPFKTSQTVQIYRCRFASLELSANIRLRENKIGFYLLPAEQSMRQSEAEDEFGPLMQFSTTCENGESSENWWVEGKPLTDDRLERYSLLFFDYFVKNSQKLVRARLQERNI